MSRSSRGGGGQQVPPAISCSCKTHAVGARAWIWMGDTRDGITATEFGVPAPSPKASDTNQAPASVEPMRWALRSAAGTAAGAVNAARAPKAPGYTWVGAVSRDAWELRPSLIAVRSRPDIAF